MEIQITGKNIKLMPEVRRRIERKVSKLSRHLPNIIEAKVEICEEKTKSPEQRFVAQVTIDSSGVLLRGEERGEDLFTAIDKVMAIMDRQIDRYKGKLHDKGRGSSLARGDFNPETEAPGLAAKVTRVKRFTVRPMPVAEAIDQMELLSHDFFLFFNIDADELNLVYRRRDGDYGLIEPELELAQEQD